MSAKYAFLPWSRMGLVAAIDAATPLTAGQAQLALNATVTANGAATASQPPAASIGLFGPGDVSGLDAGHVVRTDPPDHSTGNEPNYFALVEFDRLDLPWMFSPRAPDAAGRLRPWLCLVVVEMRDGVELSAPNGKGPRTLSIHSGAAAELPDLSEAWAWAHTQVMMESDADDDQAALAGVVKNAPQRTLSRLLCPRQLAPLRSYVACVVPTYLGGVQAGLGQAVAAATVLDDAWTLDLAAATPSAITLPVYHSWSFTTGASGDFESLLSRLKRKKLSIAEVGLRKLDVSQAGYELPSAPAVDLEGALGPERDPAYTTIGPTPAYAQRLQALVNGTATGALPVLTPPLYGRWQAGQRAIPDPRANGPALDLPWLKALNLDLRYRVPAGLGAEVVRRLQEQLMASAWAQAGAIAEANQMIRNAQMARAASSSLYSQRLATLDPVSLLQITGPAQARVAYTPRPGLTARGELAASQLPQACAGAAWRRVLHTRGGPARRFGVGDLRARRTLTASLNTGAVQAKPPGASAPAGMVSTSVIVGRSACGTDTAKLGEHVLGRWPASNLEKEAKLLSLATAVFLKAVTARHAAAIPYLNWAKALFDSAAQYFHQYPSAPAGTDALLRYYLPGYYALQNGLWYLIGAVGALGPVNPLTELLLRLALKALQSAFVPKLAELQTAAVGLAISRGQQDFEPCSEPPVTLSPALDIAEFNQTVLARLDPAVSIPARLGALITAPGWQAEELQPILAAPDFPAPMYRELAELSQEWMLPGLSGVPPDTLTLVESNPRFIEAFMVGLNHEMSRELLWRGYPTDQRGTCFRNFWDHGGAPVRDIPPISQWGNRDLGASFGQPATGETAAPAAQVVLLIRGELLQRYPTANVFLARAQWNAAGDKRDPVLSETEPADVLHPVFRGSLSPDVSFLGFAIDAITAIGDADASAQKPGWFLALEQQPTEPRFGLEAAVPPGGDTNWNDLAWRDVMAAPAYVRLQAGLRNFPAAAQTPTAWKWSAADSDSAQLAAICLRRPVRMYVHTSELL